MRLQRLSFKKPFKEHIQGLISTKNSNILKISSRFYSLFFCGYKPVAEHFKQNLIMVYFWIFLESPDTRDRYTREDYPQDTV